MALLVLPSWLAAASPVTFVAEFLVALALIVLFAVVTLGQHGGVKADGIPKLSQGTYQRFLAEERRAASRVGMSFSNWMVIRIGFFLIAALLGVVSGIPVLMVAGVAAGAFGLNWMMAPRMSKRQLALERLFLNEIKTMRNSVFEHGMSLDKSVRDMAENCDRSLRYIMEPLLSDARIDDRLAEVAERANTPLISQICGSMIMSRANDPLALKKILEDNLIPLGEGQQQVGIKAQALLTTEYSYIRAMTFLLVLFLLVSQRVPSFHQLYSSLAGQLILIADLAVFLGLLYLMNRFLGIPKGYGVNVREVARRMGGHVA